MTDNCITVNYNNIREILSLILEAEVNEEHAKVIIERLNDAVDLMEKQNERKNRKRY